MYLFLEIYGTPEEQHEWHKNLRKPLMNLIQKGTISRFVLTYHFKPLYPERARLYLSMDIPELIESTLEAFMNIRSLKEISDYVAQLDSDINIEVSDYEVRVPNAAEVDRASRGSAAALRILKEGPRDIDNLNKLVGKVIEYCGALVASWEDAAHFCFNSLRISREEEKIARQCYYDQPIPNHLREIIIKNLFEHESWKLQENPT